MKTSRRRTFHGYPKSDCGIISEVVIETRHDNRIIPDQPQDTVASSDALDLKLQPEDQEKGLMFTHDKSAPLTSIELVHEAHVQKACVGIDSTGNCAKLNEDLFKNNIGTTKVPSLLFLSKLNSVTDNPQEGNKSGNFTAAFELRNRNGVLAGAMTAKQSKDLHTVALSSEAATVSVPCTKKVPVDIDVSPSTQTEECFQGKNNIINLSCDLSSEHSKESPLDDDSLGRKVAKTENGQANEYIQDETGDRESEDQVTMSKGSSNGFEVSQETFFTKVSSQEKVSCHRKETWSHLFQEEMPRRSPRLKSKARHENSVCDGDPTRKTKTHKKYAPTCSTNASPEDHQCPFPRPSVELTKNGGPLSIIADFSLPDKEFAKLKLEKIRGNPTSNDVEGQHLVQGKMTRPENKKWRSSVQLEADDVCLFSSMPAFHSSADECLNCVPSEPTKESSLNILECSSKVAQFPEPEVLSNEWVKVTERRQYEPVMLEDEESLQDRATASDVHNCNQDEKKACQPVICRVDCGHVKQVLATPHFIKSLESKTEIKAQPNSLSSFQLCSGCDVSKEALSVEIQAEFSRDGESTAGDPDPKSSIGTICCQGHVDPCTENGQITKTSCGGMTGSSGDQKDCQSGSSVEQLSRSTTRELSLEQTFSFKCTRDPIFADTNKQAVLTEICMDLDTPQNSGAIVSLPQHPGISGRDHETITSVLVQDSCIQECVSNAVALSELSEKGQAVTPMLIQPCVPGARNAVALSQQQISEDGSCSPVLVQSKRDQILTPVLMQACLRHVTEGADNSVRAVALSTYQSSSGYGTQVKKMDAVAVCLTHVLVVWIAKLGQEWTVQHEWTLEPVSNPSDLIS